MDQPYILIFPSYGRGSVKGAVPKQVIKFLNVEQNRDYLEGIVGTGNRTFGKDYLIGARLVAHKTQKPLLYGLELTGTIDDRESVQEIWHKIIGN